MRLRRRVSTLPRTGSICRSGRRRSELRDAPDRRCRNARANRHVVPRPGGADPRIARVCTLKTGGEAQAVDVVAGEILGGVHGHVDAAVAQRLLELAGEDAARADLRERAAAIAVALGGQRHDHDRRDRAAQRGRRHLRLRHRESRRARADPDRSQLASSPSAHRQRPAPRPARPRRCSRGCPLRSRPRRRRRDRGARLRRRSMTASRSRLPSTYCGMPRGQRWTRATTGSALGAKRRRYLAAGRGHQLLVRVGGDIASPERPR